MVRGCFGPLLAGVLLVANAYGASLESAKFPSLISTLNAIDRLTLCGEKVPLKTREVRERFEKELLLTVWDRPQVVLWLKRSRRFLPHIEKELKEKNLPDDLKYVAVVESALRPHAGSQKGAVGFWQFLVATGRKYGLVINERIDERRNLFFSTRAAIRYFNDLYEMLGSWTLAVAAFNMGEQGLKAEILAQKTKDYYQLYLPLETQRYISRILAVKLIFSDPAQYGFKMSAKDFYPPLAFDSVKIENRQEVPIQIIAEAAGTHFKVIKDLNPHIRGHYLSKGSHRIHIPKGASAHFRIRYPQLADKYYLVKKKRIYVIKKGDNLSLIADKFKVPLAALIIWNRIDLKRPIHPGQHLIIFPGDQPQEKTGENHDSKVDNPGGSGD